MRWRFPCGRGRSAYSRVGAGWLERWTQAGPEYPRIRLCSKERRQSRRGFRRGFFLPFTCMFPSSRCAPLEGKLKKSGCFLHARMMSLLGWSSQPFADAAGTSPRSLSSFVIHRTTLPAGVGGTSYAAPRRRSNRSMCRRGCCFCVYTMVVKHGGGRSVWRKTSMQLVRPSSAYPWRFCSHHNAAWVRFS